MLLQGYLGDEDYWRESGITQLLAPNGWADPDRNQVAVLSGGPREILTKGAAAQLSAQGIISHIEHAEVATPLD